MIITTDRKEFNEALKDCSLTLLLFFEQDDSTVQEIEELATKVESWNMPVMIQDLAIFNDEERSAWYKDAAHCALISKPDSSGHRKVVGQIALDDLRSPKGIITVRKINAAFGKADEGGTTT